jgi:ABC-2 type transport system permease protein
VSTATLAWRQFRLERRLFWRNPSAAFFTIVLPLAFLALFGVVFRGDQEALDLIVPGIAGMAVMATTFHALAMTVTLLREQGVLKRMRGTPLPAGAYLGGLLGSAVVNAVAQVAVIAAAGWLLLGTGAPRDWLALAVFVLAGVVCLGALGVAWSLVIPSADAAPAYANAVFLPAIAISGVFYDVEEAPRWVADIAQALPLTHVIDGLSGALVTGAGLGGHLDDLAVVAVWGALGLVLAVRGFRWS